MFKAFAFASCIALAATTGYYARQPEIIISQNPTVEQMVQSWHSFPQDLQYSMVRDKLKTMPADRLYDIAQSIVIARLKGTPTEEQVPRERIEQNYRTLRDYLK